jgi:hypothetical protein
MTHRALRWYVRCLRIAIATCAAVPPQFEDDALLASALATYGVDVERTVWDDAMVRWHEFDLVVLRSTWDYPRKHASFLEWVDAREPKIQNPARIVHWNSDKHHIADLAAAGLPVVPTYFVEPLDSIPSLQGEVVVKPTVAAGGRNAGRFGPATYDQALDLIGRLQRDGQTTMIQPYVRSVDDEGETALVFLGGRFSHAARKDPVLRPDEAAPLRDDEIGAAEAMYDPNIVVSRSARDRELAVATRVIEHIRERFDATPPYARIDLVSDENGDPLVLECEAIEPNLFLSLSPESASLLAGVLIEHAPHVAA